VQKDEVSMLPIRNWKSVPRNRQKLGKKIGKAMTRIRAECHWGGGGGGGGGNQGGFGAFLGGGGFPL